MNKESGFRLPARRRGDGVLSQRAALWGGTEKGAMTMSEQGTTSSPCGPAQDVDDLIFCGETDRSVSQR